MIDDIRALTYNPPTPSLAGPLALFLHHRQTTLDDSCSMITLLFGHVQTGDQPDGVGPGREEENTSMPGALDQFGRGGGVGKGNPSHESSTSDRRGNDRGEQPRQTREQRVKVRGSVTHGGQEIGRRETRDDVMSDPGGQRLSTECRPVHAYRALVLGRQQPSSGT